MSQPYPPISIKGVILRGIGENSEVLLLRSFNQGFWDLPGGRQNSDESPEDAVRREIKEETGLIVGRGESIHSGIITISPPWIRTEKQVQIESYGFSLCNNETQSQIIISHEHLDARWVSVSDIPGMTYVPEIYKEAILAWNAKRISLPLEGACIVNDPAAITEADIERYRFTGFLVIKNALSYSDAEELRKYIENEFAKSGNQIKTFLDIPFEGQMLSGYLLSNQKTLSTLKVVFNGEMEVVDFRAVRATPGNDLSRLGRDGKAAPEIGIVYALSDSTTTNGGFYAAQGSHKQRDGNLSEVYAAALNHSSSRLIKVGAGDAILYDKSLLHTSLLPMEGKTRFEVRVDYRPKF